MSCAVSAAIGARGADADDAKLTLLVAFLASGLVLGAMVVVVMMM